MNHAVYKYSGGAWQESGCHSPFYLRIVKHVYRGKDNGCGGVKNKVATKFSRSTWGRVSGFSPSFLPRAKDQSVSGNIMPVSEITRKAVPQFFTSKGTVNVSLSTKMAEVAMIKEMHMATTDEIIIPK